ncbi:MAG: hypothetical protein NC831_04625 [Candidatus Omnitrophica bacterium]|nr:hypothetical protein [Candidatus Omnitrophota bacterium]MCM8828706.1 hypothetical protein [Candidatus Omnitrophota bacterium]
MQKIKCCFCGKDFAINEIYGFFPEDDSFLCRKCGAAAFNKNNPREKKKKRKT